MRTEEEKRAFAEECRKIEKAGGDVLGYIEANWPSYTPGGTWFNLQREYLGRKKRFTSGKPKEDEEHMNKMRAVCAELMNNYVDDPDADVECYLEQCGYTNVPCALRNLKAWAKENEPGWYEEIRYLTLRKKRRKNNNAVFAAKRAGKAASDACDSSPKDDSPKAVETPEAATEKPAEGIPQEDQFKKLGELARKVISEAIEKPKARMKVIEVETDLGSFRKEDDKIAFRRADDGKDYKNQLKMTVPQWKQLIQEMDDVLEMLEAIEY